MPPTTPPLAPVGQPSTQRSGLNTPETMKQPRVELACGVLPVKSLARMLLTRLKRVKATVPLTGSVLYITAPLPEALGKGFVNLLVANAKLLSLDKSNCSTSQDCPVWIIFHAKPCRLIPTPATTVNYTISTYQHSQPVPPPACCYLP